MENREKIVDAAYRIFAEKGMEHTTVADIIKEAGLARGTFYNHFDTIDDVWESLMQDMLQNLGELAHLARIRAADPFSFLSDAYQIAFVLFESRPEMLRMLAVNQAAARRFLQFGPTTNSIIRLLQEDMISSGFFRHLSERQLVLVTSSMIGSAFELLIQYHERGWTIHARDLANEMARLFLHGMDGMQRQVG